MGAIRKKKTKADELLRELEGNGVRQRLECVPLAKAALREAYALGVKDGKLMARRGRP